MRPEKSPKPVSRLIGVSSALPAEPGRRVPGRGPGCVRKQAEILAQARLGGPTTSPRAGQAKFTIFQIFATFPGLRVVGFGPSGAGRSRHPRARSRRPQDPDKL